MTKKYQDMANVPVHGFHRDCWLCVAHEVMSGS